MKLFYLITLLLLPLFSKEQLPDKKVVELPVLKPLQPSFSKPMKYKVYMDSIAIIESKDRYFAVNQFGYMGKYQFSKKTLKGLGYDSAQIANFINDTMWTVIVHISFMLAFVPKVIYPPLLKL